MPHFEHTLLHWGISSFSHPVPLPARLIALAFVFILSSCTPPPYAPPPQVKLPQGPEPPITRDPKAGLILAMSDPDANDHILADMFPGDVGSEWRFTGLHPKFRLDVRHTAPLYFYLRFSVTDEMVRDRGPVTIAIAIDGKPFQAPRFTTNGEREYRWPVPDGLVPAAGVIAVSLDISPPWRAPDGNLYGVFLNTVGFEER